MNLDINICDQFSFQPILFQIAHFSWKFSFLELERAFDLIFF